MDRGVKLLIEAAAKFQCSIQVKIRALILYHQFNRLSGDALYDFCTVAAAALNLSFRIEEKIINVDALVNLFYCLVHRNRTFLSANNETFKLLKASLMTVDRIMQRKLEYIFNFKVPQQYLASFLCVIFDRIRTRPAFNRAVAVTCMRFLCDVYTDPRSTHYPPEHLTVACISMALNMHGVFNCDMKVLEPWIPAFTDMTEERLKQIKLLLLQFYKCEINSVSKKSMPQTELSQSCDDFDYLYSDKPPMLTDLRTIQK